MDPKYVKALSAVGMFLITMLFGTVPVLLSKRSSFSQRSGVRHILTGLSCLGGGVFLSTCFLHLLPEATELMAEALHDQGIVTDFPIPFAIVIAGFLMVLILEQIIHSFKSSALGHSHNDYEDHDSNGPTPVPNYGAIHREENIRPVSSAEIESNGHSHEDESDDEDRMTTVSVHGDPGSHSGFRAIVMVFALSLHSVFEGITIGLQNTNHEVLQLFGAIIVHKTVIAITLGTNLVSSSTRLGFVAIFTALFVFSAMAPLGVLISIGLNNDSLLVNGSLQCLAAGTFIYITFFEILPHELNSRHTLASRLFRVTMLLLGIALMVSILILLPS